MAGWLATAVSIPEWAVVVFTGFVGLLVGSFLNVVVYRVPRGLSVVRPPSACPACGTPIRAADNVPVVSWLVLGRRCRNCQAPISARYPLVEAGTGALMALVALAVGPHWAIIGLCALAATLAASLAIELDEQSSGWRVAAIGTLLGMAGLAGAAIAERHWAHLGGAAAGAALAGAAAPVLERWLAGLAQDRDRRGAIDVVREDWRPGSWALLPAGAVLGWTGPVGAAAGTGVLCLLLLVLPSTGARRAIGTRTLPREVVRSNGARRKSRRRVLRGPLAAGGPALAAALAAVVAVGAALGAGTTLG